MNTETALDDLVARVLNGGTPSREEGLRLLRMEGGTTPEILQAAYRIRHRFRGRRVTVHILNNVQNGACPEDCAYCVQAKNSRTPVEAYAEKSEEEIFKEAEAAVRRGAFRYCMVFAGRGPSWTRIRKLAGLIRRIKASFPLEICVSAGLLDREKARVLKDAGLDRLNHNLNTSENVYKNICSTHTYQDRLETLKAAQEAGLSLCSGVIVGMGESEEDIVTMAATLRSLNVPSIPVNFYIPVDPHRLPLKNPISADKGLRILCLFRFFNPEAEIRIGAGRELYFRDVQALALWPADSLFLDGYLNAEGEGWKKTLRMIGDAGFELAGDVPLDEILRADSPRQDDGSRRGPDESVFLKDITRLRPFAAPPSRR